LLGPSSSRRDFAPLADGIIAQVRKLKVVVTTSMSLLFEIAVSYALGWDNDSRAGATGTAQRGNRRFLLPGPVSYVFSVASGYQASCSADGEIPTLPRLHEQPA
jgi:hypothetical protein